MPVNRVSKNKVLVASAVHIWNDLRIYYKEAKTISRLAPTKLIGVSNGFVPDHIESLEVVLLPAAVQGGPLGRILTRLKRHIHIARELLNENYRVFHFHDPELIFIGWLAKIRGCKVIYDMHEDALHMLQARDWLPGGVAWVLGRLLRVLEWVSGMIFDELIFAHEGIARSYSPANSSEVLNYPLEQKQHKPLVREVDEPLKLVYAGSLTKARGIDDLYHAVESLVGEGLPLELHIYGSGVDQDLLDLISRGESAGWLHYAGWLPMPELSPLLVNFHVAICPVRNLPNYRHNLLTKVLDYLGAGLPVVSSDLPGIVDNMGLNESLIYFKAGNVSELAAAIRRLLKEPFRQEAARGAYQLSTNYGWASQAKVLEEIYERCLR